MTTFLTKTAEATKKHGVKTAGGLSIATIIIAGQAYFAPLSGHRELTRDVQQLREHIAVLEWQHERAGRHTTNAP